MSVNNSVNTSVVQEKARRVIEYDDVVRLASEYETEIRHKADAIKSLTDEISKLSKGVRAKTANENQDKTLYMEGSVWMAAKMLNQINKFRQNLVMIQGDFSQKIEKYLLQPEINQMQPKMVFESYTTFCEKVEHIVNKMQERVENMRKTTLTTLNKLTEGKENFDNNASQFNPCHTLLGTISTKYDTTLSNSERNSLLFCFLTWEDKLLLTYMEVGG